MFGMSALRQTLPFTRSPILLSDKKQKATRALHRMAFARLCPQALRRFRLGVHSVRVELPVQGVMELPTVHANEHASTNPSASNSVFDNLQG
jgi:hypothetical protein